MSDIEPIIGHTYKLRHSRFGKATVKILAVEDTWIDVEVVHGTLCGMCDEWGPGETKTVRREHCTFTDTL